MLYNGYQPSFDFDLFDVPMFSPLQANEFGVETSFRANTPTPFVDFSLSQLLSVLRTPNPVPYPSQSYPRDFDIGDVVNFFQDQGAGYYDPTSGRVIGQKSATQRAEEIVANKKIDLEKAMEQYKVSNADPNQIQVEENCLVRNPFNGVCLYSVGYGKAAEEAKKQLPSGEAIGTESSKSIAKLFDFANLPPGAGIFLIGIVAVIFLLLFVRR